MTLPNFSASICEQCKEQIRSTQTWGTAAEGLQQPKAYANSILGMLCPDCRKSIYKLAEEEKRRRK